MDEKPDKDWKGVIENCEADLVDYGNGPVTYNPARCVPGEFYDTANSACATCCPMN
jgi:hypothetical protein